MSTNFYIRGHRSSDDPLYHIGKRSAAGPYCWDCNMTLCILGEEAIHYSARNAFHAACPLCQQKPKDEGHASTGSRELGFNSAPPARKMGVASCSSFTWAMDPDRLFKDSITTPLVCPCCSRPFDDDKVVEDEYGKTYSMDEFKQVLDECPVQYKNSIGTVFS